MRKRYIQNTKNTRRSYVNYKVNEDFGERFRKTIDTSNNEDDEESQRLLREEDRRMGVNTFADFEKCFNEALTTILDKYRDEAEGSYYIRDRSSFERYGEEDFLDTLIKELLIDKFSEYSDLSALVQDKFSQDTIDYIQRLYPDVDFSEEEDVESMFITEFKDVLELFQDDLTNSDIQVEIYGREDDDWKRAYEDYKKYLYQVNCFLDNLEDEGLFPDGGVHVYIRKKDNEKDPVFVMSWTIAATIDNIVNMYESELLDDYLVKKVDD